MASNNPAGPDVPCNWLKVAELGQAFGQSADGLIGYGAGVVIGWRQVGHLLFDQAWSGCWQLMHCFRMCSCHLRKSVGVFMGLVFCWFRVWVGLAFRWCQRNGLISTKLFVINAMIIRIRFIITKFSEGLYKIYVNIICTM